MSESPTHALVLISDERLRGRVCEMLTSLGQGVVIREEVALSSARHVAMLPDLDCAIVSASLSDGDVLGWLSILESQGLRLPTIVISAQDQITFAQRALTRGADDCLSIERLDAAILANSVEYAINRHALARFNEGLTSTDRHSAVGRFASGVAREVNNPSSWVLSNLEMMRTSLKEMLGVVERGRAPRPGALRELTQWVDECVDGMDRITSTIQQLKDYAALRIDDTGRVDLNAMIRQVLRVWRLEHGHQVRIIEEYEPRVPVFVGDINALSQVVANLLANAVDAIEVDPRKGREHFVYVRTEIRESWLVLNVEDTGAGLSDDEMHRAFDPFFTTRFDGQGRGMGLTISREIIERHHGFIEFLEDPDSDSTIVEVRLPTSTHNDTIPDLPAEEDTQPDFEDARLRVLSVIPASKIGTLKRVLHGHELVAVTSVHDAIQLVRSDKHFDGVLYDITMPGMNGSAFYNALSIQAFELVERVVFLVPANPPLSMDAFLTRFRGRVLREPLSDDGLSDCFRLWGTVH